MGKMSHFVHSSNTRTIWNSVFQTVKVIFIFMVPCIVTLY